VKARVAILSIAAWASVAAAQAPSDIARCTAIGSNTERLACYDKLFAHPEEKKMPEGEPKASQSNAASGAPAATATAAAESAATQAKSGIDDFGLDGRKPGEQHPAEPKGPDQIEARVTQVTTQPRGEAVLTLDNGQVWQQQEYDWHLAFESGDDVLIKRGLLKSYRLQQKGNNRSTPVTRIR
jgi:hypothetical protein